MVVVDTDVVILPPSSRLDSKGSTKPGKKCSDYERIGIGNVFFANCTMKIFGSKSASGHLNISENCMVSFIFPQFLQYLSNYYLMIFRFLHLEKSPILQIFQRK